MPRRLIQAWCDKGSRLAVPGTAATRIWRQGSGPSVVCLHGLPASAFLYRKILPELASRELEGVAMDFPGAGFADRPADFNYTWTGYSAWLEQALAAQIDTFHLVVHDYGGPVGFDLVRRMPQRVLSLTVLNTFVKVATFSKPLIMRPFTVPGLRRLWVLLMKTPVLVLFFRWKGVLDRPSRQEIRAYGELLTMGDGGRAFLKTMSSFETNQAFEQRILMPLRKRNFPAQIIWGKYDTELTASAMGANLKRALDLQTEIQLVKVGRGFRTTQNDSDVRIKKGKHFLQEDCPEQIADRIAMLVKAGRDI